MLSRPFCLFLCAIFALSCGPATRVEKSWLNPAGFTRFNDFSKVLIIVFAHSQTARRTAEDQFAAVLAPRGITSYNNPKVMVNGPDANAISEAIKSDGFDAALVTRLIDKKKETTYVPGNIHYPFYGGFRGYFRFGYGAYMTPGYYQENTTYFVETNVYDLKSDRLVWSCVTATTQPGKMDKTIHELSDVVFAQMKSDGFYQ